MFPKLLDLGPLSVYSYGLLLALAYLGGLQMAVWRAKARGLDGTKILDLGVGIIIAALVGAKLMLLVVDFDYFSANPAELLSLARSGGVFYGGLILASLVAIWQVRRLHLPVWATGDIIAPGIALGLVVGRLGCFLGGCCYGRETHLPWAVTFTSPLALANVGTPLNVPLHPTQLYEAGAAAIILAGLLVFERRGRAFAGRTFWVYILAYAISRFVIEFFRGDPRGVVLSLPTSQFIALALMPLSLVMLVYLGRRQPSAQEPGRKARRHA
jgi:phosphatidylglycerol---prolipoprotein diacylglyceryl transferase